MTSPPDRTPAELAAAQAALARPCRSCGHPYAAHAPDGCRTCQILQGHGLGEPCTGWALADSPPDALGDIRHLNLGPVGQGGAPPTDDEPPALGEVEQAADAIADGMARAIGGAEDDDDTTRRVLAVLRGNRAGLELILAADDVVDAEVLDPVGDAIRAVLEPYVGATWTADAAAAATISVVTVLEEHADDVAAYLRLDRTAVKLLRRVVMDYGGPACDEGCMCSAAQARAFLAARGIQVG